MMNNRTNQRQVGRLTGRVEVDAGLLRYRDLLSRGHIVAADSRSPRRSAFFQRSSEGQRHRRAARVAAAGLLLVLAFSALGAAAQCAGCLYLTPETSGGGNAVHAAWRTPEVALSDGEDVVVAVSEGTFELVATGKFYLEEPAQYTGELVVGPYKFAP